MTIDSNEAKSKEIFSRIPATDPSAYFAARVAARASEKPAREVVLWRWIAACSMAAVVALVTYIQFQPKQDVLYTYEPYVIQVDFTEQEIKLVESAEINLPEGVSFVSKNHAVKELRSLKLPVDAKSGRLPFVVVSELAGSVPLEIRMYNSQDQLIDTKTLTLHFGRKG